MAPGYKNRDARKKGDKAGKSGGFQSLGLSKDVFKAVMKMGYKVPTPIQRKTLPIAISGRDVVAMARTGETSISVKLLPYYGDLKPRSSAYQGPERRLPSLSRCLRGSRNILHASESVR